MFLILQQWWYPNLVNQIINKQPLELNATENNLIYVYIYISMSSNMCNDYYRAIRTLRTILISFLPTCNNDILHPHYVSVTVCQENSYFTTSCEMDIEGSEELIVKVSIGHSSVYSHGQGKPSPTIGGSTRTARGAHSTERPTD